VEGEGAEDWAGFRCRNCNAPTPHTKRDRRGVLRVTWLCDDCDIPAITNKSYRRKDRDDHTNENVRRISKR